MNELLQKPLNPRTWPSLYLLIFLLPVTGFLCKVTLHLPFKTSISATIPLMVLIIIKTRVILNDRYERLKIFEKGNVPSVSNTNVLSGNLFECIVPGNNTEIIDNWHKKLGKTFGLFYGPDPWVFTTDLDLLQKIFVEDGHKCIDAVQFRLPYTKEMNLSLASLQGEQWRTVRKILNPSFSKKQMKSDNVYEDIDKNCNKILDCIYQHQVEPQSNQNQACSRVVEISYLCRRFTLEVTFQVAYGHEKSVKLIAYERDTLVDKMIEGTKLIVSPITHLSVVLDGAQNFLGPLVKLTPIGSYIRYIHKILDESLRERRKFSHKIDARSRKMIDSIIESVNSNMIDDDKLKANLFFIFIAGFETTATTLTILFWLLSKHQQVQDKLRSSIIIEGSQSKYLHWCIQETLRLYPAVPTGAGRILQNDLQHNGMHFFKGTSINASVTSIHHSKEYWGEDAEEFRPERFNEPIAKQHPLQFFAFAHGPRYCIGMNLAYAEIENLVTKIVLKYKLEKCSTTPEKLNITSQNVVHWIINHDMNIKFIELSSL